MFELQPSCGGMSLLSALWRRAPACTGVPRPLVSSCRAFCSGVSDEAKEQVLNFLKAASRPKMGKAKAKQSAGQRALDLTRSAKALDDLDLPGLLRLKGADLKKREIPCQERKRLSRYIAKANQGYTWVGEPYWKNWREPAHWREAHFGNTWPQRPLPPKKL